MCSSDLDALGEIGGRLERLRHGMGDVEVRALLSSAVVLIGRSRDAVRDAVQSGAAPAQLPVQAPVDPALTRRESEILRLVAAGRTNAAIGRELGLTANTVKTYWQATMRKLDVGNRAEAIHAAHRLGLLAAGTPEGRDPRG